MTAAQDLVFRTLADPTRRAIYERLCQHGEQTVWMLTDYAGVSQPAVSKHLGALKRARLVRRSRQGRETRYSADARGLSPLFDWMSHYGAFWRERFDRLEAVMKGMDDD